uniref:Odorant receptor n=1 Tax=Mythimna separata TaxID=271217 RepID=A0A7H1DHA9_MYTSE|nr:olfactory receptor 47 [Mythimna separata]
MKIFSSQEYFKTIGEWNDFDNVMRLPLFVQEILGQNVLDPTWNLRTRMAKQIFFIILITYVMIGTKEFLKDATDITEIGEAYYTFQITFFFSVKYLLFINTRETFKKSYMMAKTSVLDIIRADSTEKLTEMLGKVKIVVRVLFAGVLCPVVMYLVVAFWHYVTGTRVTLSKTTSILMPMTTPYYEIGLVLHTIYLVEMAFTYCVIDLWFAVLMFTFCVASDSVVNKLKVESRGPDETELEYMDRLNNTLRSFYKNHAILMEYFNITSHMFKWPALIPLVSVLFAVCLILLCMTEQIQWMFLSNLVPIMSEIFAYNILGEQINSKGIQFYTALLEFDWASMRLKDKKNYLIIISYLNKDFKMKTALGTELSLVTLTSVLKSGYQVFAMINTMET